MRFQNKEELINYLETVALNEYEITFTKIEGGCTIPVTEAAKETKLIESATLSTLSSKPSVAVKVDDTLEEHVMYVDDFDSVPFSCSTGKVSVLGANLFMNLCESDDTGPVVHMDIIVEGKQYNNLPFKLKKIGDEKRDYILVLNPNKLA